MPLTKSSIVKSLSSGTGMSKAQSAQLSETLLEIIKSTLASGEDVLIRGFGKFRVKDKRERVGRNPATAQAMNLRARRVVAFKCSGVLRDKINGES